MCLLLFSGGGGLFVFVLCVSIKTLDKTAV